MSARGCLHTASVVCKYESDYHTYGSCSGLRGTLAVMLLCRVILELPNNDICCGVELTPEDREGPKSSA